MRSIKAPKVMNSNESISDIDEEDFLLIKHNTLKHLKLDLFVAADNPLHDSLEALKGDIVPARGAIASAKNIGDLQVALYQMRAKMKAMEDIAKKDKIHSVGEYIKTVAAKVGLYEDPQDYLKKRKEYYAERRRKEAIRFQEIAAMQEVERQLEKDKKPNVGLLESAKLVSVFVSSVAKKIKDYKSRIGDVTDSKSLKDMVAELKDYDHIKWLGVGSPLTIGDKQYELIKGQATQLINKFSLESVGINPDESMAPRDMLSFLNNTNSVLGLIGQSVGIKERTVGLDGKVAVWFSGESIGGAEASLNNEGGSILRVSEGVSAGNAVNAWTHSFVNYSLPGSISSLVDDVDMSAILSSPSVVPVPPVAVEVNNAEAKATPAGLSSGLIEGVTGGDNPAVSFEMDSSTAVKDVSYMSSVSGFTIATAKAVMSGNQADVETLKAGMDDIARDSFFKALMGDNYLNLSDVEKKGLSSAEMVGAVKDYVTGKGSDIDLIGALYKNELLDLPGLGESIGDKLKNPSVELSGVVQALRMGYGDMGQVLKSAEEIYPTQMLYKIADMKEGVIKVDKINPATVELLGRYIEKKLFPNVNGVESGVKVTKSLDDTQFTSNMERVLTTVIGSENRIGSVRALTQEQINEKSVDLSKGVAEVLNKVNGGVTNVKAEMRNNINLDLTAGVKLEAQAENIKKGIVSKLSDNLTVEQGEQLIKTTGVEIDKLKNINKNKPTPDEGLNISNELIKATEDEISKLMKLKEKGPTPDEGLKMNNDLIRENREKRAQERTELSAEAKAKKLKEEEENNPFLKKMRAPNPTDIFDI